MDNERKKILIVDDEPEAITHLERILQRNNYDIVFTDKGKEVVSLARDIEPDVIILDVLLPDMMGGEIEQKLSQDAATKDIPIILLSGLNTKEDERIIKECGIKRVLSKPATVQQILEAVHDAIVSR